MLGSISVLIYLLALNTAIERHTLHTVNRYLLSAPSIFIVVALGVGGGWAIYDLVREARAGNRRRRYERQTPFAVRAEQRWRDDLTRTREQGDRRAEGIALGNIGFWLNAQDHFSEAEGYLTQALEIARSVDDRFHEERNLWNLGQSAFGQGHLDEAETLFRESLAITLTLTRERLPYPKPRDESVLEEAADSCAAFGEFLAAERGKHEEGCQMFAEAETRYREMARLYETAAQSYRPRSRKRALEDTFRRQALAAEQHMRDLQRQYGGDVQ